MDRIKTALGNNRSRVATALSAVLTVVIYVVSDYLKVDTGTATTVVAATVAPIVAYILGNGYYETQTAVLDRIPEPPKK